MVTDIEQLKKISNTQEVELPPFADGTPFVAKIKKASMFDMMNNGTITNPLILSSMEVLGENAENSNANASDMSNNIEAIKFIKSVVEQCLIEPKMSDIIQYVGGLTDEQTLAIYEIATSKTALENMAKFC